MDDTKYELRAQNLSIAQVKNGNVMLEMTERIVPSLQNLVEIPSNVTFWGWKMGLLPL